MTIEVGDKLQYRGGAVLTVIYKTDQHVLATDDTGHEQAIGVWYLNEGGWEINGLRNHFNIHGLYSVSSSAATLRLEPNLRDGWISVDQHQDVDLIQISEDGTWTFINREGEPVT